MFHWSNFSNIYGLICVLKGRWVGDEKSVILFRIFEVFKEWHNLDMIGTLRAFYGIYIYTVMSIRDGGLGF